MRRHPFTHLLFVPMLVTTAHAMDPDTSYVLPVTVSAGMGANYQNPRDVVEMINGTYRPSSRVAEFVVAVDFFGALNVPLSADWVAKFEYAYLLATTNVSSSMFGASEFTMSIHMPTVFLQYVLFATPLYSLKAGAGAGFHFGELEVRYWGLSDTYSATGPAMAFDLEGETAFSEHVFIYLGANVRWSFVGELKNEAGRVVGVSVRGDTAGLHQFGIGARLGFSYQF
jgi:hypothetical protein